MPQGKLEGYQYTSQIMRQERKLTVYTPVAYERGSDGCGLLIMFDGRETAYDAKEIPVPLILDNLIAAQTIPPIVVLLVHQVDREKELRCSEPFADFVAKELVPWMETHYGIGAKPHRVIVSGASLGGLMSAYCAYRHSERIGNVLSMSGSVNQNPLGEAENAEPGWLIREYVVGPPRDVQFFLPIGQFENHFPQNAVVETRRFRDVLRAKGYAVEYREFSGQHDCVGWRGAFVDGLIRLTSSWK